MLRASALAGVTFSAVATVEYYGTRTGFCAPGGGCDAVRTSTLGRSLGQVLPLLGVVGFSLVLGGTLVRAPAVQRAALRR